MNQIPLPAGEYYIGDPCYVFDEEWSDFCDLLFENDVFEWKGQKVFVHQTAWGDGTYPLMENESIMVSNLGVDAGVIGALPVSLVERKIDERLSKVVTFEEPFVPYYEDGAFYFRGATTNKILYSILTSDEEVDEDETDIGYYDVDEDEEDSEPYFDGD